MCLRRVIGPLPSGVYLFKTAMAISKITRWIVRDPQGLQHRPEERETTIPPNGVQRADDPGNQTSTVNVNARLLRTRTCSFPKNPRSPNRSPRASFDHSPHASQSRQPKMPSKTNVPSVLTPSISPATSSASSLGTSSNAFLKPSPATAPLPSVRVTAQAKLSPPP